MPLNVSNSLSTVWKKRHKFRSFSTSPIDQKGEKEEGSSWENWQFSKEMKKPGVKLKSNRDKNAYAQLNFCAYFRSTGLYRYPFCQQNTACAHMKMNGSHLIFRCCKREARCLQRINAQWAWLVLESVEKWSMGLEIFYILILKSYYFKWSP